MEKKKSLDMISLKEILQVIGRRSSYSLILSMRLCLSLPMDGLSKSKDC